ncbi:MAG: LCP family protein [bacterium]|nr:LCP family protein [bacterium]
MEEKFIDTLKKRKVGMSLLVLQLVASVVAICIMANLHILSYGKVAIVVCAEAVLFGVVAYLHGGKKEKVSMIAKVLSVVLILGNVLVSFYCAEARGTIGKVTGNNVQIDRVSIYVLKDSNATTINDIADGTFGLLTIDSTDKIDETVATVNKNVNKEIKTTKYTDAVSVAKALYEKQADSIIMDDAYVSVIEEDNTYKDFSDKTKILSTYEHSTTLKNQNAVSDITDKSFSVFLSGNDTFGSIKTKSRCDVNMIVTVNPKTKQILLTSTPRDYYVPTTVSNGVRDKLTHAGNSGIECSTGTIENLYNIKINYYVKVNFTGFKEIVDALGGITVHSDLDFTSEQGPAFVKGDNKMNGKQALAFARERHAFKDQDLQRNKDQQYVVKGIVDKVCSPAILTKFTEVLKGVEGSIITNMPYDDIASFVQMQLNDNAKWDIISVGLTGTDATKTTFSMPHKKAYVMIPDDNQVKNAKQLIEKVMAGEVFTDEEAKAFVKAKASPAPTATTAGN